MPNRYWADEPSDTVAVCDGCRGNGEVAVAGTYGATVSPENLVTFPCPDCSGSGVLPA